MAPGGTLLAIAARHTDDEKIGPGLPWPHREEIEVFTTDGLTFNRIER